MTAPTERGVLAGTRDWQIARDVETIAEERSFLEHGVGRDIRTLRQLAFRTIRRAQRRLALAANEIERARTGAAS